jgi:hypothetical protein
LSQTFGYEGFMSVTEMKQQVAEVTAQVEGLRNQTEETNLSLRRQIHTLNEMMMLIQIFTGNKELDAAMRKVQQFIMVLMRLRMLLFAISEIQAGTIGGPIGIAYGIANLIGFGMSINTLGQ